MLEGKEKDELFDYMMHLAMQLASLGYTITEEWKWMNHETQ
jgi:hypothetical protein